MSRLSYAERPAAERAAGLLVLHHGRGTDERDLLPLADALDPTRSLHVVSPRGPLTVPGWPGHHWYFVPRVGHPDPDTFAAAYEQLAELHDELWRRTGLDAGRTVLGGFSMGAVMSYALGLGADRPTPAGILALSGFILTVAGWRPSFPDVPARPRVFIAHGTEDPVIAVEFARAARETLEDAGAALEYREFRGAHEVDPGLLADARGWLDGALAPALQGNSVEDQA